MLDRSTENIKEIDWSDVNTVLNEITDYYLKKFENKKNITDYYLRQFEQAVTDELCGIKLEDYLKTNNCSLYLISKCNKILQIKNNFFNSNYLGSEIVIGNSKKKKAPIETYIKEMEEKLKERQNETIHASIDANASIEDIENDYSAIADLLGDENIVIKFKENE